MVSYKILQALPGHKSFFFQNLKIFFKVRWFIDHKYGADGISRYNVDFQRHFRPTLGGLRVTERA